YRELHGPQGSRADRTGSVVVPPDDHPEPKGQNAQTIRESLSVQALVASVGQQMGFRIWIPKHDRAGVLQEWKASEGALLDVLPLNYDDTTLQTIENIDVLWLKNRSIVRAFEVEHTTAIYSGILRRADSLALQPITDT